MNIRLILLKTIEHFFLTYTAILIAVVLSIILAIVALYSQWASRIIILISNLGQSIPSFAVLALMIPLIGLGVEAVLIAILLRAMLPIIKNTYTGLTTVDPALIDSAKALGLTRLQLLWYIRLPNAIPGIFSGIKFAAILANSIAVLGGLIDAPGLGTIIFTGLAQLNTTKLLSGAIPVMLIAVVLEFSFDLVEHELKPRNIG